MLETGNFIGNSKAVSYLRKALEKSQISHAYIFEGPRAVGKSALALRFAAALLGDKAESVRRNPDLLYIAPEAGESLIEVEKIRELQKSLALYPFGARYKVAVIDGAELMNHTAANALLKTLEEPGETSVLILVTSDAEKLLATIRSRCQSVAFSTVAESALRAGLADRIGSQALDEVIRLAEGRPGIALDYIADKDALKGAQASSSQVLALLGADSFTKMQEAAALGALEKEEAARVLDIWTAALRAELKEAIGRDTDKTARLVRALGKTIAAKEDILTSSVNLRLCLENLCLQL